MDKLTAVKNCKSYEQPVYLKKDYYAETLESSNCLKGPKVYTNKQDNVLSNHPSLFVEFVSPALWI
jgi:hypothetical protein